MARRLNATDAYLIMQNLVKQATGETTSIAEGDVSAYISAGEKVLATGMENTLEALSIVLGRTLIAVRPYKARNSVIRAASFDEYKTRMRKISYYTDKALPTGAWNTQVYTKNLGPGRDNTEGADGYGTKSMWEQHPVIPLEMNFGGFDTWDEAITIYKKQLRIAMRDPEEMAKYLNGQMMSKTNDIELEKEAYDTMNLIGYLGALFDANKVLNNGMAVNMTAEFNNFYSTNYTTQELLTDYLKEFTGFFVSFVKTMVDDFKKYTLKRHWSPAKQVNGIDYYLCRTTNKDNIKLVMYDPFWKKVEATVFPEVFNENYLKFDNFESVTYWQSNTPGNQAKLDVSPALPDITGTHSGQQYKGDRVQLYYVLGAIFDKDACMTNYGLDDADATPMEARKKFYNLWWNFLKQATIDLTEQGCLLYMADNASGGKSTVVDPSILDGSITFQ
jgi:hypothetical protein